MYDLGTIHDVNPFIFKVGDRYYFKGNDSGASKLLYTDALNSRKVATLTEIKANLSDLSALNTPAAGVNIASTEIEILGTPIIYKNDLYISGVQRINTPHEYRIWKNTEITQLPGIKLGSGQANINAKNLTVFNDKLYFRGRPQTLSDYGIWEYDGTTTTEVLNNGYINGSEYHSLIEFNNKLHVFASYKSGTVTDNYIFSIDAAANIDGVGYAHKAFRAHGIYNNHLIYSAIDTDEDSGEEFFEIRTIEAASEPYAFNSLYFESLAQ